MTIVRIVVDGLETVFNQNAEVIADLLSLNLQRKPSFISNMKAP